jgi:hypothetical protein
MMSRLLRTLLVGAILTACQATAIQPAAVEPVVTPASTAAPTPRATPMRTPQAKATPAPTTTPAPTPPPTVAFAMNLYRDGDFVPQHTFEWCVGASIQMASNMIVAKTRSSYADQQALWELARSHSTNSLRGANPRGWTAALNEIGIGPYDLVMVADYADALRTAAAAIRRTQRPVGLVMWSGRHAWVMSGFESVGDPAVHDDFRVTGVRIVDPLYPHGSGLWGPSPEPNSLLSPKELAKQFVVREPRRWSYEFGTGYFLVLPVADA